MSSSQSFVCSSPAASTPRRRRSRFTYRHLSQLASYSSACPLRVVAHVDLDAFYAQCEMIRLGVAEDQPLAVQQWGSFIAINYPARTFGLSRFATAVEAKKVCPHLIMQHVATWKEGEPTWAYYEDAPDNIATHKVSLDPYRLQSRKILALIKAALPPPPMQRVEKASIDEVFLDLSAHVHSILLERYPELNAPPPYDDPSENLPRPPTTALDWDTDAVIDLDETETEDDDPDWDDVAMLIGSEIVRSVRATVRERLRYTCSAGVAQNKMLAKLGSGHNKPNKQTIVRNRAVQQFLSGFKFTKIRNLGGKLGDEIMSIYGIDTVSELLKIPIEQLKRKLGDETGTWIHQIIRGLDHSEVNPRTQIKSMLSAKSFRPSINSYDQAERWLRIFVADIFSRLVEEGVLDNKRRPRTINLQHRHRGQTKARSSAIPTGKAMDEGMLFDLARNLMHHIIAEGNPWPCSNLSLSVGGFEDGVTGNRNIGSFLVTGKEATALRESAMATAMAMAPGAPSLDPHEPFSKRRKVNRDEGIQRFFRKNTDESDKATDSEPMPEKDPPDDRGAQGERGAVQRSGSSMDQEADEALTGTPPRQQADAEEEGSGDDDEETGPTYRCPRCHETLSVHQKEEHDDWHLAKELQREEEKKKKQASPRIGRGSDGGGGGGGGGEGGRRRRRGGTGAGGRGGGGGGNPWSRLSSSSTITTTAAATATTNKVERGQSRLMFN